MRPGCSTWRSWIRKARGGNAAGFFDGDDREFAWGSRIRQGLRAARRVFVDEAEEVVDIEKRERGGLVAVRGGVARGEVVLEAGEVVDVEDGGRGGGIAVGVAGDGEPGRG